MKCSECKEDAVVYYFLDMKNPVPDGFVEPPQNIYRCKEHARANQIRCSTIKESQAKFLEEGKYFEPENIEIFDVMYYYGGRL